MDTLETEYFSDPFDKKQSKVKDLFFRSGPLRIEDELYFASGIDNSVLKFNVRTKDYKWIEVGERANRYSGIEWKGDSFWLSPRYYSSIVKWDGNKNIEEIQINSAGVHSAIPFCGIVARREKLIIPAMPGSEVGTIVISQSGEIQYEKSNYTFYKQIDRDEYVYQSEDGNLTYVNANGQCHSYDCEIPDEGFGREIRRAGIDSHEYIENITIENPEINLKKWISLI